MDTELTDFVKRLRANKRKLTWQQYKTIKGQAVSGNIKDAEKGLCRLLNRRRG